MKKILIVLLLISLFVAAQTEEKKDTWESLKYFIGKWQGTGEGKGGISSVSREYKMILNEKFIKFNNKSIFEPQEKNQEGEIHEDIGFISFDNIRQTFVLRQFHVEGFVNQYVLTFSNEEKTGAFNSESIENLPPGWKVRLTFTILNENEFTESFDLAGPDQKFTCYITNHFIRIDK